MSSEQGKSYAKIPTFDNGVWTYTVFHTKQDLITLVEKVFKVPGTCEFDEVSYMFNEHAQFFNKHGVYTLSPSGSKDWVRYWDTEKEKCRKGVIFKNGDKIWYLPRFYYHWLNFLKLYNKELKDFVFPDIRDVQYYLALYLSLCQLKGKHACILKRRQVAASFLIDALVYNRYIFERGFVGKIVASNKTFLTGNNGSWRYLNMYHTFNTNHTAWACENNPGKELNWQQRQEVKLPDGRKSIIGTEATITGLTLEADPVGSVGGATDVMFYEEGGIAPTADETYAYMVEAMKEGAVTTGLFIISGSVGNLDQCNPLKTFVEDPDAFGFLGVHTKLIDEHGTEGIKGLFIAAPWGYYPYIDKYGNSLIEEALKDIEEEFRIKKEKLSPEKYQIGKSQKPRNIKEAFAIRTQSMFPAKYTTAQQRRIENKTYYLEHLELERNEDESIKVIEATRSPCTYHGSSKTDQDKRGCLVVHERPITTAPWLTYFGVIDPVEKGSTVTSDSLASIYIYMNPITRTIDGKVGVYGGKLVAEWVGRYDDLDDTNEMLSMIVEWYNAFTMCENNKPSFIQHMRVKKRQRYLARKSDMVFDREVNQTSENIQFTEYGIHMTEQLWSKLLEYAIEFLSHKISSKVRSDNEGNEKEIVQYGVERIPFVELIHEMQEYGPKGNFDRLKAFGILCGFLKAQEAKLGKLSKIEKPIEVDRDAEEEAKKIMKAMLTRQPFRNMGKPSSGTKSLIKRTAFRNMG